MVGLLLDKGANLAAEDKHGWSVLHYGISTYPSSRRYPAPLFLQDQSQGGQSEVGTDAGVDAAGSVWTFEEGEFVIVTLSNTPYIDNETWLAPEVNDLISR